MDAGDALPHDLLEVASPQALVAGAPPPAWVGVSLRRAPFVVVRRAAPSGTLLPVGVRGDARRERFAAFLPAEDALRRIRPEDLAALHRPGAPARAPALAAVALVAEHMAALRLTWGPTGSVGFELATGVAAVTPASDLDVLARAPDPLPRDAARWLVEHLAALPCRVDVQLETPAGAVALAEYAAGPRRILARTPCGPRLVESPWAAPAATVPR